MTSSRDSNIALMVHVASNLVDLLDDVVFVGGCVVGLLIDDKAAPDVRPTTDVDLVVEVVSLGDYNEFEKKLRSLGFSQAGIDKPLYCRW